MGVWKMLRQAIFMALVIIGLLVIAAVVYLLFFSPRHAFPDITNSNATTERLPLTPTAPAENAKEGVAIQAIAPTVARGTMMSVVATTNATSRCTIKVDSTTVKQNDPDLAPQIADDYGTVTWNWQVSTTAPLGAQSLTITCVYRGRTGVVVRAYAITKN